MALSQVPANRTVYVPVLEKWYGPSQPCVLRIPLPPNSCMFITASCLSLPRWKMQLMLKCFEISQWKLLDFTHTKTTQKAASWDIQGKKLLLNTSLFLCFGCPPCIKQQGRKAVAFGFLRFSRDSYPLVCTEVQVNSREKRYFCPKIALLIPSLLPDTCNYMLPLPQGRLQPLCFQAVLG